MIAIIEYNAGNTTSVKNAVERLGYTCEVTKSKDKIYDAEKVIFPGVGEASSAMRFLKEHKLDEVIKNVKQPLLGICLGQQLLCKHSEEGDVDCLGIFPIQVKKFPDAEIVPHMGWNNLQNINHELLEGITETDDVYFVHSYYCELSKFTIAECDYILSFSAVMKKDNFYTTQFHPEKSAGIGEVILSNFLKIKK